MMYGKAKTKQSRKKIKKSRYTTEFKDWIENRVAKLKWIVGLSEYTMELKFCHKNMEDPDSEGQVEAAIFVDTTYLQLRLNIFPVLQDYWKKGQIDKVWGVLLHEMSHPFLEPVFDYVKSRFGDSPKEMNVVFERQTQRIAMALYQLSPEEWSKPMKKKRKKRAKKS